MKITIIHAHWNNRGDEAALRALIDELLLKYIYAEINVCLMTAKVMQFEYDQPNVHLFNISYPRRKNKLDYWLTYLSKGKIALLDNSKAFVEMLKGSDLVLHGPGGPSIGDIYYNDEEKYLLRLNMIRKMGVKYAFYAPSMGPFRYGDSKRNNLRRRVLNGAEFIYLRENQSAEFVKEFGIDKKKIHVALDSAFQHYGDEDKYNKQLEEYTELSKFLNSHEKVIGITITDLKWHPVHSKKTELEEKIRESFTSFITEMNKRNIGVVFVPQLFGGQHDITYMGSFAQDNCFVVDDEHDCYFQQHLISKLYAVVGMRYHSNIFSAKMGTPFISVSYEQKMSGFMEISGLADYCISIDNLSAADLIAKFDVLEGNYDSYRLTLKQKRTEWSEQAHKTTDAVFKILGN